jgi:hypothetical protein
MSELGELLSYLKLESGSLAKTAAIAVSRYSIDTEARKIASTILHEQVNIDLWEMESLIRPDKFQFPEPDVGLVGVENEEVDEEVI